MLEDLSRASLVRDQVREKELVLKDVSIVLGKDKLMLKRDFLEYLDHVPFVVVKE
jgi:hypothetical protein